jgi:hypothetical protein
MGRRLGEGKLPAVGRRERSLGSCPRTQGKVHCNSSESMGCSWTVASPSSEANLTGQSSERTEASRASSS